VSERDGIRGDRPQPRRRAPPVRPKAGPCEPTSAALGWLADRGISGEAVARRNRIGSARTYIPGLNAEVDCIAFPYFRDGELVNIKFRPLSAKAFT
jgi:twinkle protein